MNLIDKQDKTEMFNANHEKKIVGVSNSQSQLLTNKEIIKNKLVMSKGEFEKLREFVIDEKKSYPKTQYLKNRYEKTYEKLFKNLKIESPEQAEEKALKIISKTLKVLEPVLNFNNIEPGHGIGHITADYIHTIILSEKLEMDPKQEYIGTIAAVLHDILGCTLVDRYADAHRAVRHAEAGGLVFLEVARKMGINSDEALLVYYAIAAHTHIRNISEVECSDGIKRQVSPYININENEEPIISVHFPRWVDRLDICGVRVVGRQYLTMAEEHKDLNKEGNYYTVSFFEHMRPLLRTDEERGVENRTFREHINMLASTQNNQSPYGKFDYGTMAEIRDSYKNRIFRIVESFEKLIKLSSKEAENLLDKWTKFLYTHIEPSESGRNAAEKLQKMFPTLPQKTQESWYSAMQTTLKEYDEWVTETRAELSKLPKEKLELPVLGDVRDIL